MNIAKITALGAVMMLCCGQQAPPAPTNSGARESYETAVADYKKCVAVKPFDECEGQRRTMDAAAKAMESAR
ncbi:MAG: hypothetical protein WBQ55_01690 [Xanthobacteraceae bacterium]|jgi:hypothetical protein